MKIKIIYVSNKIKSKTMANNICNNKINKQQTKIGSDTDY